MRKFFGIDTFKKCFESLRFSEVRKLIKLESTKLMLTGALRLGPGIKNQLCPSKTF